MSERAFNERLDAVRLQAGSRPLFNSIPVNRKKVDFCQGSPLLISRAADNLSERGQSILHDLDLVLAGSLGGEGADECICPLFRNFDLAHCGRFLGGVDHIDFNLPAAVS